MMAELELERQKTIEQLTLKREEIAANIELKRLELEAEIEMDREKMGLEREKVHADRDAKTTVMHKALSDVVIKLPKRKIKINRNTDGFMESIDIDDVGAA